MECSGIAYKEIYAEAIQPWTDYDCICQYKDLGKVLASKKGVEDFKSIALVPEEMDKLEDCKMNKRILK